jgi:hypothetical protein
MRNTVQILQKGQKVSEHTQVKTPAKQMIFPRILASNWATYQQFMRLCTQKFLRKMSVRCQEGLEAFACCSLVRENSGGLFFFGVRWYYCKSFSFCGGIKMCLI